MAVMPNSLGRDAASHLAEPGPGNPHGRLRIDFWQVVKSLENGAEFRRTMRARPLTLAEPPKAH